MQTLPTNEIDSLSQATTGSKISGFGIVLDTTRGIRTKSHLQQVEYSTQIKLIDHSLNPAPGFDTTHIKGHLAIFIYWTNEVHQPFTYKVGDILRFINFDVEEYKGQLQGKNKKGSSWSLIHADGDNESYYHSSEYRETFTQHHNQKIHELRRWSSLYFQQYSLKDLDWYSYERHIENPVIVFSFDMLLKVDELRILSADPGTLLVILRDEKLTRYETHVSSIHTEFLKEGDLVKLRSIEKIDNNYLRGHSRYFAILGVPSTFRDYHEFVQNTNNAQQAKSPETEIVTEVAGANDDEESMVPALYTGFDYSLFEKGGILLTGGSILSSGIGQRHKNIPMKSAMEVLREVEQEDLDKVVKDDAKFHLRLTLIDIRPKSLLQSLRNECKICGLTRKLDAQEGETCCMRKMEKTMLLRLLWQDQSLKASKKLLITYVLPKKDSTRSLFPDLPVKDVKLGQLEDFDAKWKDIVEKYLEDDRLFDILVEPFDDLSLKDKDEQTPLRIVDTLFVSVTH